MTVTLDVDRYSPALPWMNAASLGIISGVVRVTAGGLGLRCRAGPQRPGCTPRFRVSLQVAT